MFVFGSSVRTVFGKNLAEARFSNLASVWDLEDHSDLVLASSSGVVLAEAYTSVLGQLCL
jgi:hypothetical protein